MNGRLTIIIMIIVAIVFVVTFASSDISRWYHHKQFVERGYSGIIDSLKYDPMNRGLPSVFMNNKWTTFGLDEMRLAYKISVGDSLVKIPGHEEIYCYRLDSLGQRTLIIMQ
jgi:hypothetical protein